MTDLRLLLAMVDRSGRVVAAEEHEDAFEEYEAIALRSGVLPGLSGGPRDATAAGMLDVDIYLGMGLALLGQIGVRVLHKVGEKAVEKSAGGIVDYVSGLFRRGKAETEAVVDAITADVAVRIGKDLPVTAEQVKVVVTIQLEAIAHAGDNRAG